MEKEIEILYAGSHCPPDASMIWSHDFEHLKEEKIFICRKCGLTIKIKGDSIKNK